MGLLGLRQRRRMQQIDAIAQRLHEEFKLRAASGSAIAPGEATPQFPGSPTVGRPAEDNGIANVATAQRARTPPRGLRSQVTIAKKGVPDVHGRRLEAQIGSLARRFALIRDLL